MGGTGNFSEVCLRKEYVSQFGIPIYPRIRILKMLAEIQKIIVDFDLPSSNNLLIISPAKMLIKGINAMG